MATPVIVGYGLTKIGEHWKKDLVSLGYDAAKEALSRAGKPDIDAIYVGNMLGMALDLQGNLGGYLADELGYPGVPALRIEASGASGAYSIAEAAKAIKSGLYDFVLAGGVEKMSDSLPSEVYYALNFSEDMYIMNSTGLTNAGLNAILMRLYMERYNVAKEKITYLAVQDHENAQYAPHAQFRRPITLELAMSSMTLADPINLFDASPIGDGAAFVVMTSKEKAKNLGLDYVEVAGIGISTNVYSIVERDDPLWFRASNKAFSSALEMAGASRSDVDFLEIHDEYTIMGVLALESLGFSSKGAGAEDVWSRRYSLKGETPINTFGGLKARGNPVGATGAYQVCEAFMQLTGEAGENKVENAKVGVVHSMGGVDNTSVVLVLRR